MPATDEATWLETQITAVEAQITAINAAILVVAGGAQSYSLDTGQTRQSVTKTTLFDLNRVLESREERRSSLIAKLDAVNGTSSSGGVGFAVIARPGW